MMFVAPVLRMAVTISCMPATVNPAPPQLPPSRQQLQAEVVLLPPSGWGSLYGSNKTALLFLKRCATDDQKALLWSRSAITCCPVASWLPAAVKCRLMIAAMVLEARVLTSFATALWYVAPDGLAPAMPNA